MATTGVYNKYKALGLSSINLATDDIRVLLVSSSYTFNPDHNFVSDITNELTGTGYVRKALAGESVTQDNANDRSIFDASDVTWTGADFGTPDGAIIYKEAASDATRELICCIDLSPKVLTNTGNYTVNFNALGILRAGNGANMYNRGLQIINEGLNFTSADIRVLLTTSAYTYNADHNFVSDITNELVGTGYSRQALVNKTVNEDDTNDRVVFDADDITYATINAGTPANAIIYVHTGTDSTSELICRVALSPAIATNGFPWTLGWSVNGIFRSA